MILHEATLSRLCWLAVVCSAHLALTRAAMAWPRCQGAPLAAGTASELGADPGLAADLDSLLQDAVSSGETAAAALVVLRRGKVLYRGGAGGARPDSVFDLASLTKVLATAPLVMRLAEAGKLDLDAPASLHLPALATPDKAAITVRQLLLHTSGLPSVVWMKRRDSLPAEAAPPLARAALKHAPGSRWLYSDTGFIALGELAERLLELPLDRAVEREVLEPLGMCNSGFNPPAEVLGRVVSAWPPAKESAGSRRGQAYDPLVFALGGAAGHAGLFGSADDVARLGAAMLAGGALAGRRVLSGASVTEMTRPHPLPGGKGARGLGWDISSPHAGSRGSLSAGSYGHTGYTGTSLWVDPALHVVVALLTNRTRLDPARSVTPLRRRVHGALVEALLQPPASPVSTGLDRLALQGFAPLRGLRVGLITNRAAVDSGGRWIGDLLLAQPEVRLAALFVPEHGLDADQDRHIRDGVLHAGQRSLPVHSLFGPRRRPRPEALAGLDALVFDVPAVGVRYYTYLSTMGWAMEEAARRKLRFVVLDRPDPLGGDRVQGPLADPGRRTSTNYHPLPARYGMTLGEVARYYNGERRLKVDLQVVPASGWRRGQRFRTQGLPWRNPSPNIRSWRQALLYAGVGLLESTPLSVGRGTDSPFALLGAPWIDGQALLAHLRRTRIAGVHFTAAAFTPTESVYKGTSCQGVRVVLTDAARLDPPRMGVVLALALRRLYPDRWDTKNLHRLLHHPATTRAILAGAAVEKVAALWVRGLSAFRNIRIKYTLYR